ncbi:hypothetical protein M758_N020100 [Ceratodon purpureus]|nr:hypothetical protein M758_N020100 [Ceratodon purpureus]
MPLGSQGRREEKRRGEGRCRSGGSGVECLLSLPRHRLAAASGASPHSHSHCSLHLAAGTSQLWSCAIVCFLRDLHLQAFGSLLQFGADESTVASLLCGWH